MFRCFDLTNIFETCFFLNITICLLLSQHARSCFVGELLKCFCTPKRYQFQNNNLTDEYNELTAYAAKQKKISWLSNSTFGSVIFLSARCNTLKDAAKAPTVDLSRLNILRRPIRKSVGGGRGKNKNKIMQERVTEKHIVQRRSEGKDVLQSKLHYRAYKQYSLERQLGSLFILQFNFLVLVESHSPSFLCN